MLVYGTASTYQLPLQLLFYQKKNFRSSKTTGPRWYQFRCCTKNHSIPPLFFVDYLFWGLNEYKSPLNARKSREIKKSGWTSLNFGKNWMSFLVRRSGSWPGKLKFRKIFWICFPEFSCKGSKVVLTYDCDAENKKNENHNTNIYDGTFHFEISDLRKSNFTFTRAYCLARQLTFLSWSVK